MPELRKSKQRDAIMENLMQRHDHPTAMEVYLEVREKFPNLSLGTLYRNLKQLCEAEKLICFSLGDEEHYDANTELHYHLRCNQCHRFFDVDFPKLDALTEPTIPNFKGEVFDHQLIFFGLCEECSAKNRLK